MLPLPGDWSQKTVLRIGSPRFGSGGGGQAAVAALPRSSGGSPIPRARLDWPGGPVHRPTRRGTARAGDLSEHDGCHRRPADRQVRLVPQLRRRMAQRQLPAGTAEHDRLHARLAGDRVGRRRDPRSRARASVPRSLVFSVADLASVGGARGRQHDWLSLDLRLSVQRRELDARPRSDAWRWPFLSVPTRELGTRRDRPPSVGARRQDPTPQPSAMARPADSRDARNHLRAGLANPALRNRDLHRRALVDSDRGARRREGRRRHGPAQVLVRHPAAAAADRHGRALVRNRLHGDRHDRRLHPHERRSFQHYAHAHDLGLPDGSRLQQSRRGSCDLALSAARLADRDGFDAALRPTGRGFVGMWSTLRERGISYLIVGPFAIVLAFPFYWMLVTAFKANGDLYNLNNVPFTYHRSQAALGEKFPFRHDHWLPFGFENATTSHVSFIFHNTNYLRWVENTAVVGGLVVAITLLFAVPAGYSLARLSGRWGQSVGVGIFLTYLVPPTLLFLPLSRVISKLGLPDRICSLVLVYPSFTIPFATWLLMGFFRTIPAELEDAALVDGCSRLKALARVIFPISIPGILTVVIFSFSLCVNEFVYAITFVSGTKQHTISAGVPTDLIRGDDHFWQSLMAATLIPSIPLALLYNSFLNRFIAGFTGGAFR